MKITLRNFLKKNFFFITITILNLYIFNLFLNIFIISKNDYETRLINNGGYCEKGGYGFIKFVKEKYTISNNIRIENFNNFPAYESLFHKIVYPMILMNQEILVLHPSSVVNDVI